jgi:hypothetical protein
MYTDSSSYELIQNASGYLLSPNKTVEVAKPLSSCAVSLHVRESFFYSQILTPPPLLWQLCSAPELRDTCIQFIP